MGNPRLQLDIVGADKSGRAFRSVRQEIDTTSAALTKFTRGFGAAVGAFGLARFVGGIRSAIDELDLLAKRARTVGLSTDVFQGLQVAAEESTVSLNVLDGSLIAFVKRVGEAKNGIGPLVSGLKGNNEQLLEAIKRTDSQEEALQLLARAIANSKSETEKAALANAAFSRSGVELVRVFEQQEGSLQKIVERGKELGLVMDRDLFPRAEQAANDLAIAGKVMQTVWNEFAVEVSPAVVLALESMGGLVREFRRETDLLKKDLNALAKAMTPELTTRIETLQNEIGDLQGLIGAALVDPFQASSQTVKDWQKQLESAQSRLQELINQQSQFLRNTSDRRLIALAGGGDTGGGGGGTGGGRGVSNVPLPRANPFRDETAAGRAAFERSSIAVRRAQAEADRLANKLDDVRDAGTIAFEEIGRSAEQFLSGLELTGNRVLDQLIGKLGSLGLQNFLTPGPKTISGGGGLPSGGISSGFSFTDLFSFAGTRAGGGPVQRGQFVQAGERPELLFAGSSGRIMPLAGGQPIINIMDNAGVDISASTGSNLDGQQVINLVVNSRQFGAAVDRQINRGTSAGLRR